MPAPSRPGVAARVRETGRCLTIESGVVESPDGFFDDMSVAYDDGRQRTTVSITGDEEPAVGSRVQLEWWDGQVVALYDLSRERRYKTGAWPQRWEAAGVGFLLLAGTLFLPLTRRGRY